VPGPAAGDLVEVTGPAAGQPVLVSRLWLAEAVESGPTRVAPCHPVTGALVSGDAIVRGDAYRPSVRTAKRIRARDRRCRFPGCSVAAVFCDLDHVRPWPVGRTTDDNLLCLCRRHHRVKQRPGWRVTLTPDGVASWTDPTGKVRTTHPVDALDTTILTASSTGREESTAQVGTSRARTIPDGPHTALEFRLEHLATTPVSTTGGRRHRHPPDSSWRDHNGTRHGVELSVTTELIVLHHLTTPCRRPRRRGRHAFPDEPPF